MTETHGPNQEHTAVCMRCRITDLLTKEGILTAETVKSGEVIDALVGLVANITVSVCQGVGFFAGINLGVIQSAMGKHFERALKSYAEQARQQEAAAEGQNAPTTATPQ